ncbi:hypothetical protein OPV22_001630 [Ensete ventricosum]|uniref:Uncharacterized protein n=1 Tax=Ensete ventricosum TaxID=4639 RepID=A0AAV8RSL8_ENSVE|nr:hypothetical protein OPV22_001630 [Ensete ventricosum]
MLAQRPGLGGLVVVDIPEIEDTKTEETPLDLALTLIDAIAYGHRDPPHPNHPRRRNPRRQKATSALHFGQKEAGVNVLGFLIDRRKMPEESSEKASIA